MTRYCTQCGTTLAPDAAFCTTCGQAVPAAPSPRRKQHVGRNVGIGAGAFLGLFILLGLAGAWDEEPQPAGATAVPKPDAGRYQHIHARRHAH